MFAQKKSLTIKVLLAAMVLSTMAGIVATSSTEAQAGYSARTAEIWTVSIVWRNPHNNQTYTTSHFPSRKWFWNGHSWSNQGEDDGGIRSTSGSMTSQGWVYQTHTARFWRYGTW